MPVVAAALIPALIGAGEAVYSGIKENKAQKKANALFAQRQVYKTPSQVFDIYNQSLNQSQSGFDPATMSYLTSQADGGLANVLGAAKLNGGDPNNFSKILDQNFQDIFRIGAESNSIKMKKFDSLIAATQLLAGNKDAEFASRDNLLKDQLQTQNQRIQAYGASVQSGVNTAISGAANALTYYGNNTKTKTAPGAFNPLANDE